MPRKKTTKTAKKSSVKKTVKKTAPKTKKSDVYEVEVVVNNESFETESKDIDGIAEFLVNGLPFIKTSVLLKLSKDKKDFERVLFPAKARMIFRNKESATALVKSLTLMLNE